MSKFSKGHNSGKVDRIRSKVNQVIYSSSSISWPSLKPPSSNTFLRYLADKISFWSFQKGITPERETTRTRRTYGFAIFPWGIHIRNFKTLACMVHKIWHASKHVMKGYTDAWTDNPKLICPFNFFKVGGITKFVISLVTTSGNIDFDFTEKSQYFIGKHIRK